MAAAVADQYPKFTISAGIETTSLEMSDLFDDWLANIAINLAGPLFDAGFRKAEAERTRAALSEKINNYSQQLVKAVQEVEDALNQEHHQQQYIETVNQQLVLARKSYDSVTQQYLKGQLDYLRVLELLVSQQTLERTELSARRVLIEHRIDLCRAIAGSWEMQRPEEVAMNNNDNR